MKSLKKTLVQLVGLLAFLSAQACGVSGLPSPTIINANTQLPSVTSDSGENMLVLTLVSEQETYTSTQAVSVRLGLKNVSDQTVVINKRLAVNYALAPASARDVAFLVTRPSGRMSEFQLIVTLRLPQKDDFVSLAAGETFEQKYQLAALYALNETGPYSVQALYQNQSDPGDGRIAWKGELKSNTVQFTIAP